MCAIGFRYTCFTKKHFESHPRLYSMSCLYREYTMQYSLYDLLAFGTIIPMKCCICKNAECKINVYMFVIDGIVSFNV